MWNLPEFNTYHSLFDLLSFIQLNAINQIKVSTQTPMPRGQDGLGKRPIRIKNRERMI